MSLLILYFLGAYLFTWSFHLMMPLLKIEKDSKLGFILYNVGLIGPLASAVLLSWHRGGGAGVRDLLLGAFRWRMGIGLYVAAFFSVGLLYLAAIGLYVLFGGKVSERIFVRPAGGIWLLLLGQVFVVTAEEFGWRGFALPLMHSHFGALGASLLLGILWAGWHLPMFFVPGSGQYRGNFAVYVLVLSIWSVMMTFLYDQSGGSTLIAMVFHAAVNIWFFVMQLPKGATKYVLFLYVLAAIALIPFLLHPLVSFVW